MADDRLPELVSIPAGPFVMGSDDGTAAERPAHSVNLNAFTIGAQPITNGEYGRFVAETGYRIPAVDELPLVVVAGGQERERNFRASAGNYTWTGSHPPHDRLDHPVTLVRWDDAAAYCRWLSNVLGRTIRLPTEAEWEKAARGGLKGQPYPWGEHLDRAKANYLTDPAMKTVHGTTPCRTYPPNAYGLFDMAGNVWEWVHDWYDPGYYAVSPKNNPGGPANGQFRIVRGGGWLAAEAAMLTCSHRHQVPPDTYSYGIGFRVACPES
jgi:formylglycine-generating enzyme required for sulfatase activity